MSATDPSFDEAERAEIVRTWRQVSSQWAPRSLQPLGLALVIAAVGLFFSVPIFVRAMHWTSGAWLKNGVLVVCVLLFIGGVLVAQVRLVEAFPLSLATTAAAALASGAGDRRRHAVELLFFAFDPEGPGMRSTFEIDAMTTQLGEALSYVRAVERVLVEELRIARVLTRADPP